MCIIGDWYINTLSELEKKGEINFDWNIAAMPHPDGIYPNTTWGTVTPVSLSSSSKKINSSWKFIKYASGIGGARIIANKGYLPAYINDDIKKIFDKGGDKRPKNLKILSDAKVYLENPSIEGADIIKDKIFGKESELTLDGSRDIDDTFDVILNRLMNEFNDYN